MVASGWWVGAEYTDGFGRVPLLVAAFLFVTSAPAVSISGPAPGVPPCKAGRRLAKPI